MKNTQYFPHDFNARHDPDISLLISEFGAAAYAIFWCIVEMLHEEEGNRLEVKDRFYKSLSVQMSLDLETTKAIIERLIEYELLILEGDQIYSERVLRNAENREKVIQQRSAAGRASAESRRRKTNANTESTPVEHPLDSVEHSLNGAQHASTNKRKGNKKKDNNACVSFGDWWDRYDRKKDRARAEMVWNKLSEKERELCVTVVGDYVASTPDPQYRKYPLTYLRGKCWQDELTSKTPTRESLKPKLLNEKYSTI